VPEDNKSAVVLVFKVGYGLLALLFAGICAWLAVVLAEEHHAGAVMITSIVVLAVLVVFVNGSSIYLNIVDYGRARKSRQELDAIKIDRKQEIESLEQRHIATSQQRDKALSELELMDGRIVAKDREIYDLKRQLDNAVIEKGDAERENETALRAVNELNRQLRDSVKSDDSLQGNAKVETVAERTRKLADDLYEFLKEIGREPVFPDGLSEADKNRIFKETWDPWHNRMFWAYEHKFRERIANFVIELLANGIAPNFEELSRVRTADMQLKGIREQAERLLILSKIIELDLPRDIPRSAKT
jgi:hypothetical protein